MIDCFEDIVSDFSVFHHIAEPETLPTARFFSLAVRLPAYDGALAVSLAHRGAAPAQTPTAPPPPSAPALAPGDTPPEQVAAMRRAAFARHHKVDPSEISYVSTDELVVEMMR